VRGKGRRGRSAGFLGAAAQDILDPMGRTSRTRRTIRFALIGLCIAVAAGGVLQLEQRRPVMELERAGASAVVDEDGSVKTVSFCSPDAGDAHLQLISRLTTVSCLNLARSTITADGVRQLAVLPRLEMLDVSETPNGAGMLEVLAEFPALRTLQLRRCPWLTDADLPALLRLASLESLMISEASITDAGLDILAQCTNLTQLGIDRCDGVTDAGVRRLAATGRLESASINQCRQLTDASVCELARQPSLADLSACGIPMSRSALQTIAREHPGLSLTLDRFAISEWQPLLDAGARIGLDASYELNWVELDDRSIDPALISPYSRAPDPEREPGSPSGELEEELVSNPQDVLNCLAAIPELRRLYLRNLPISDEQLLQLRQLPQLQQLSLENVPVTDQGLWTLAEYDSLESLWLLKVSVCGEGVAALGGLPKLKELALLTDCMTQSGLEAVTTLRQLEALAIGDVSSLSIGSGLSQMPNLSRLALVRATLTADDVQKLCASARLEDLELLRANLAIDAFRPMAEMSALQTLYLGRCEFDRSALLRLIDLRPDLQIYGAAGLSRGSPRAAMMPERGRMLGGIPLVFPNSPNTVR